MSFSAWGETAGLLAGLFQGWNSGKGPTAEERDLWRRVCENWDQDKLREAIREHRIRTRFNDPRLGEVRELYYASLQGTRRVPQSAWDIDEAVEDAIRADQADTLSKLEALPRDELLAWRDAFLESCPRVVAWCGKAKQETDDPSEWGAMFCGLLYAWLSKDGHAALRASREAMAFRRKESA